MAHPNPLRSQTGVIRAIYLAEEAGREMTDTEVAALASGALEVDDLQVLPTKTAEQRPESSEEITSSSEGDDDDSDDTEDDDVHESSHLEDSVKVEMPIPDGASVHTEGASVRSPESTPADMEVDCAHVDAIKCKVEEGTETVGAGAGAESCSSAVANVQGEENNTAGGGGAGTPTVPVEEDNQAEESSSCSDESDGDNIPDANFTHQKRKSKGTPYRARGALAWQAVGDVSDDDDDGGGMGVPMTQNEEEEAILPLGEVTIADDDDVKVGTILSLVEVDGTIVVRGSTGSKPLDEGSVLSSEVQGAENADAKEPLGRIHEIFGPTHTPHYTVRVEGAADHHMLETRYQMAVKKLMKAEQDWAEKAKARATPVVEASSSAATSPAPVPSPARIPTASVAQDQVSTDCTLEESSITLTEATGLVSVTSPVHPPTAEAAQEQAAAGCDLETNPSSPTEVVTEESRREDRAAGTISVNGGEATRVTLDGEQSQVDGTILPTTSDAMNDEDQVVHDPNAVSNNEVGGDESSSPTKDSESHAKRQPLEANVEEDPVLVQLREAVRDAERAMGDRKKHPFSRWKLNAPVYALKKHSTYLSREKLATGKGTDASNCHDEEAQEEEFFSDDEKERVAKQEEHKLKKRSTLMKQGIPEDEIDQILEIEERKRRMKLERKRPDRDYSSNASRGGRGRGRGRGGRGERGDRRGAKFTETDVDGSGNGVANRRLGRMSPAPIHATGSRMMLAPQSQPMIAHPLISSPHQPSAVMLHAPGVAASGVQFTPNGIPIFSIGAPPTALPPQQGYGAQPVHFSPQQIQNPPQYVQQQQYPSPQQLVHPQQQPQAQVVIQQMSMPTPPASPGPVPGGAFGTYGHGNLASLQQVPLPSLQGPHQRGLYVPPSRRGRGHSRGHRQGSDSRRKR